MAKINLFELRREMFHMLVGILFILIAMFFPHGQLFLFLVLIFGGLISFLSTQYNIPIFTKFLCIFERECNKKFPGKGVLFFFVGSLLAFQLFPENIALASIIIATFSDPISHFVGTNFGKTPGFNKRKYIEGTISGILAGTLFASFFVSPLLAFSGAFIAMFFEAIEIAMAGHNIDDNLLIPIIAGTVMYLLGLRFGLI